MVYNALLAGEHDWMKGKTPSGQPLQTPQMATPAQAPKKRNPVMNALSAVFEYGAPEAFEAGRQKRMTRDVGNALAGGDYAGAANTYLKGGNIEQGLAVRGMAQEQETARRQQEAQGIVSLFSNGPEMVNRVAMEDPAGFERMTGMTADEYLQAAGRFGDGGAEFAKYALAKAQAELGETATTNEYGAPMEAVDAQGNPVFVQWSKTGEVRPLEGYRPPAEQPSAQWEEYTPPGGIPGLFIKSAQTGEIKRVAGPQSGGIRVGPDGSVQIGGPVDGLGYGSAPSGQDAAIAFDRDGNPVVTPGPQQEQYNKAIRGFEEFKAQNSIVVEDIDRALGSISSWSTGAGAALKDLPIVGGITPAGQLESLLETIQANVGFDKLQAMREASPTGGALGSVTERELAFLQAVFGSLRQDTSPENVRYNLQRLKEHMMGREQRIADAIAADFPSLATTAQRRGATNQQLQTLNDDEAAELEQLRRELGIE
jgi:hypothetical protein